jgi:hypothetical protein
MKMKNFAKPSPTISISKPSNDSEMEHDNLSSTLFGCIVVNARTILFRRIYLLQMICFPFIPILALFIQNLSIFLQQSHANNEMRYVNQQVGTFTSLWYHSCEFEFSLCNKMEFFLKDLVNCQRIEAFECNSTGTVYFYFSFFNK